MKLVNDFGECGIDYLFLSNKGKILGARLYSPNLSTVKSFIAQISNGDRKFTVQNDIEESLHETAVDRRHNKYSNVVKRVSLGYSSYYDGILAINDINKSCVITTEKTMIDDFYNMLLNNFDLPILYEWIPVLYKELLKESVISKGIVYCKDYTRSIDLYGTGNRIPIKDILIYDLSKLQEDKLEKVISECLQSRDIIIAEKEISNTVPLELEGGLGSYMALYGSDIVDNKTKEIIPLAKTAGVVKNVAYLDKKPFPQQATCVNGMIELSKRSKYGFMVEEMGTGKSLQALFTAEGIAHDKYLRMYPGKSLKDVYKEGVINYRAIIMCPGHLLEKWAAEILENVPFSKVTILSADGLKNLMDIRNTKPHGKEYFIVSKDKAKLSYPVLPAPTKEAYRYIAFKFCRRCYDERNSHVVMKYGESCPVCDSKKFRTVSKKNTSEDSIYKDKFHGMLCPQCDKLLIKNFESIEELGKDNVVQSSDFDKHTDYNDMCFYCGSKLWRPSVKTTGPDKKSKWVKFRHYANFKKKSIVGKFVLRKNYLSYINEIDPELVVSDSVGENGEPGMEEITLYKRKISLAQYIKNYLNFDICILDEAHKYEGAGTAQSVAAQAIAGKSKFTLCLTGTLLNGKASSIFYLLYMLDSRRMRSFGYRYDDELKFSYKYGSVETIYQYDAPACLEYNKNSRGRLIKPATVKPGISPLLYTDFLFDKAVMLNISDMSQFMPPLVEKVIPVDLEDDIKGKYRGIMQTLKSLVRSAEGKSVLGSILVTGLSYTDKPYGRKPIMSSYTKNLTLCNLPDCTPYAKGKLTNKEQELIKLVKQERKEDRNVFIFCSYTGSGDLCITGRLKEIVERECNLEGEVFVMEASSPAAIKREEFFHKKAAEGIKVFICNFKIVETGMDFRFKFDQRYFNYPTIIFYQYSYELASIWQASGRHYRLNQIEECRTYYLASVDTMQVEALQILAEKKAAVSAIQGKFSSEGLAAMAKGIDEKVRLAQALSENYTSDVDNIEGMFDVLNQANSVKLDNTIIKEYNEAIDFYTLTGMDKSSITVDDNDKSIFEFLEYEDDNINSKSNIEDDHIFEYISNNDDYSEADIEEDIVLEKTVPEEVISKEVYEDDEADAADAADNDFTLDIIEEFLFDNVIHSRVHYESKSVVNNLMQESMSDTDNLTLKGKGKKPNKKDNKNKARKQKLRQMSILDLI